MMLLCYSRESGNTLPPPHGGGNPNMQKTFNIILQFISLFLFGFPPARERLNITRSDSVKRVIALLHFPHFDTASCFDLFKEKERGPV
jgi:hypothetical protein